MAPVMILPCGLRLRWIWARRAAPGPRIPALGGESGGEIADFSGEIALHTL
jgi:hypothetical protein